MPKLIIDEREILVPKGTKVIEAAESLGIMIPRFCYHKALGSLGACRMCAVKFLEGPVKGIEMSCMIEAKDGMVVSTTHPEAVEFRRYVIEWLMLNHPHDCPVCDEGGHCLLQDETVSGGHGLRRYQGLKRTYIDQYLGEFVQHEMNRCIHCWRCRRFYQEFAGYRDLGALQIGNHTYFGRFEAGPLESPFAGNIIDICPTGVFTDKPARFKGRRWDFQRAPSLCLHCSLGCNTVGSARYREVMRLEARFNDQVNGYFICDRGRFGFGYANHPQRPRQARLKEREIVLAEAIQATASRLKEIVQSAGPRAIACWGASRSSLETMAELTRLCRGLNWQPPRFFTDVPLAKKTKLAVSRLDTQIGVSLRELEKADFILVAAADPLNEAPMLALALRQAFRRGARVVVLDPRPVSLPFEFTHIPVPVGSVNICLGLISRLTLEGDAGAGLAPKARDFFKALPTEYPFPSLVGELLAETAAKLKTSQNPVLVSGTKIARETTPGLVADLTLLLRAGGQEAKVFFLLPGPNAFGAALLSGRGELDADPLAALEDGTIKALVLVENDALWSYPDRERLTEALKKLDLLVVLDYLPGDLAAQSQIFLPTTTVFENSASHYINQEGRVQQAVPLHLGGLPISQLGPSHPPREFLQNIPGGEPRPAGEILAAIFRSLAASQENQVEADLWTYLAQENEWFAGLKNLPETERTAGVPILPPGSESVAFSSPLPERLEAIPEGQVELLLVDQIFGTEELASYSPFIQKVEGEPYLVLHEDTAQAWGLAPGEQVTVILPGGEVTVLLKTAGNMSPAVAILPQHRRLSWQKVNRQPVWLGKDSFKKALA